MFQEIESCLESVDGGQKTSTEGGESREDTPHRIPDVDKMPNTAQKIVNKVISQKNPQANASSVKKGPVKVGGRKAKPALYTSK